MIAGSGSDPSQEISGPDPSAAVSPETTTARGRSFKQRSPSAAVIAEAADVDRW